METRIKKINNQISKFIRAGANKMRENQHIEWKETWHDEYIKWLCGFANAQGGTLVIGKNDSG